MSAGEDPSQACVAGALGFGLHPEEADLLWARGLLAVAFADSLGAGWGSRVGARHPIVSLKTWSSVSGGSFKGSAFWSPWKCWLNWPHLRGDGLVSLTPSWTCPWPAVQSSALF